MSARYRSHGTPRFLMRQLKFGWRPKGWHLRNRHHMKQFYWGERAAPRRKEHSPTVGPGLHCTARWKRIRHQRKVTALQAIFGRTYEAR